MARSSDHRRAWPPTASSIPCRKPSGTSTALQCGFCTPGMIMAAKQILERNPNPTEEEIRARPGRQSLPLHRLPAHRQRGESCRGERRNGGTMATTITKTETLVGKRIRRREDPRLITGTATYVDDIKMPGMHHACIVRSPHAAAKIKSIDIKPALELPGVAAVFTGKDTEKSARCRAAHPCPACAFRIIICWRWTASTSSGIRWRWWWRRIATSRATPPIWSKWITNRCPPSPIRKKRSRRARPAVHPEWPDNTAFTFPPGRRRGRQGFRRSRRGGEAAHHQPAPDSHGDGNARRGGATGARAIKRADRCTPPRRSRTWCERWWRRCSAWKRTALRVVTPEVGGGFGSKLNVYAEEALMGFVAMKIGKPVKWIESRRENFTVHHSRPRPRGLLRSRRQARRHHPRDQAEADPGSGRVITSC